MPITTKVLRIAVSTTALTALVTGGLHMVTLPVGDLTVPPDESAEYADMRHSSPTKRDVRLQAVRPVRPSRDTERTEVLNTSGRRSTVIRAGRILRARRMSTGFEKLDNRMRDEFQSHYYRSQRLRRKDVTAESTYKSPLVPQK
ncbi:hypothetical protein COW95_02800 [Candidatus Peregrinibacteria bacterium CG22_combo_CG10-13_8_21_14_all_49_11]|nr:MAG: hypothetical protein COW95_02800 [Candidatus Peregrinibacteria bacterium CG22_combo_CG10-13_8_21_14_all_49_11]